MTNESSKPKACCSARAPANETCPESTNTLYSAAVDELVAIGAAIACNCERCFKYHYAQARKLGVTNEDMARAVAMAQKVKSSPASAILDLAQRHLRGAFVPDTNATASDPCAQPDLNEPDEAPLPCCAKNHG